MSQMIGYNHCLSLWFLTHVIIQDKVQNHYVPHFLNTKSYVTKIFLTKLSNLFAFDNN